MSKVAAMQPYLFPYFGYFQLINAVDHYVFLDDVAFIKKGHINRNSLNINNSTYRFTIPVEKISQNKMINEHFTTTGWSDRLLKTIEQSYNKAKYFRKYKNLIFSLIKSCEQENVYLAAEKTNLMICDELGINTNFYRSSDFAVKELKAENKIIKLCKSFDASMYINPIGGLKLDFYQQERFDPIKLRFIERKDSLSNLSIIDLLFTQNVEYLKEQLNEYELVSK